MNSALDFGKGFDSALWKITTEDHDPEQEAFRCISQTKCENMIGRCRVACYNIRPTQI